MTYKLYPPYIEGKIPAFTGNLLRIPFRLNRAVSYSEIGGIQIVIKSMSSNSIKATLKATNYWYDTESKQYYANFDISDKFSPNVGQYYKIQMAFLSKQEGIVGYYSTVGIIKYTTEPKVEIVNLNIGSNIHKYEYTGRYSQEDGDITEKIYSYCFNLYDFENNLIATSGEQVHNSSLDEAPSYSTDTWYVNKSLKNNIPYTIEYKVKTLNGIEANSVLYRIYQFEDVESNIPATLHAEVNNEDGYVKLYLKGDGSGKTATGRYILSRSSSQSNYEDWHTLCKFNLIKEYPNYLPLWEDYTVEQGIEYIYSIQAYNSNNLYSSKMLNNEGIITCNFEDMFLFDGERQLNIRFNPKVSSFKTTVLESKIDTIGGQFPFVFRNGNVEYKEFPISGLISFLSDPNNKFLNNTFEAILSRPSTPGQDNRSMTLYTDPIPDNILREREFKIKVLEWLNNGEPKLFRSPTEGNFIVRLMNVSLTPNDTLGRMIHTFNATAYEIADCSLENLEKYGIVQFPEERNKGEILQIRQKTLSDKERIITLPPGYIVSIEEAPIGTEILLEFLNEGIKQSICIGTTGAYYVNPKDKPVASIELAEGSSWEGSKLNYSYYYTIDLAEDFSYITNITIKDEIRQFKRNTFVTNLIEKEIEDVRRELGNIHLLRIQPKEIIPIYLKDGNYYKDEAGTDLITYWNPLALYFNGTSYYIGGFDSSQGVSAFDKNDLETTIKINNEHIIDFGAREETQSAYELSNLGKIKELYVGNGLEVDMVYQVMEKEYGIELVDIDIINAKDAWLKEIENYNQAIKNNPEQKLGTYKIESAYRDYCNKLQEKLDDEAIL